MPHVLYTRVCVSVRLSSSRFYVINISKEICLLSILCYLDLRIMSRWLCRSWGRREGEIVDKFSPFFLRFLGVEHDVWRDIENMCVKQKHECMRRKANREEESFYVTEKTFFLLLILNSQPKSLFSLSTQIIFLFPFTLISPRWY